MLRYQHLLTESLKRMTVRELNKASGIPTGSISDYINMDVLPRAEGLRKLSRYYNEPLASLVCKHTPFLAEIITALDKMSGKEMKQLLKYISELKE